MGGAQPGAEEDELLARIRARMQTNLSRLPDHVCQQTVERLRRQEPGADFQRMDTLRLEVGLIGDREMFAWPDAKQFQEKEMADLIGKGTIGTGNFGLHARNVFLSDAPEFTYRGEVRLEGRRAIRYDFEVPLERSTYRIRVPPNEALVGFEGSFWVDAATLDLIRLEVRTEEIPPQLGLARARDVMGYARLEIGGGDFLLPSSSELRMLGVAGNESLNRTQFSDCRQFKGEARLTFAAPAVEAPSARKRTAGLRLPPRTVLELSLDAEIDLEKAVVGDPVRALVARPIKEAERVLAPAGATVLGRLVRLERYDNPAHYVVGLEFHTLEVSGSRMEFSASLVDAGPAAGLIRQAKRLDPTFTRRRTPKLQILVGEFQRGQGVVHWEAKRPRIPKGFRMRWQTEAQQ